MQRSDHLVFVLAIFAGTPARAEDVTFRFQGTISQVTDYDGVLAKTISVGDTFSGAYTFSSTASYAYPTGYPTMPPFTLTAGSLSLTSAGPGYIVVNNSSSDSYIAGPYGFTSNGLNISEMGIMLLDPSGTAFSAIQLPLQPPPFEKFSSRFFRMTGNGGTSYFSVTGVVTSLTPEPGTALLLAIAGVPLMTCRRRALKPFDGHHHQAIMPAEGLAEGLAEGGDQGLDCASGGTLGSASLAASLTLRLA